MKIKRILFLMIFSLTLSINSQSQVKIDLLKDRNTTNILPKIEEKTYFGLNLEEIKTLGTVGVPLLILLITNIITLWKIRKDTTEAIRKELTISIIKTHKERLEKFYDPILTFTSINEEIFKNFGPRTFPDDHIKNEIAVELWNKMVQTTIIPNNSKITDVIKNFSHLISRNDELKYYLDFVRHAESYYYFINFPTERHKFNTFPKDFRGNLSKRRQEVIEEITSFENDLTGLLKKIKK